LFIEGITPKVLKDGNSSPAIKVADPPLLVKIPLVMMGRLGLILRKAKKATLPTSLIEGKPSKEVKRSSGAAISVKA
jgi:hypothetical protein